MSDRDSLFGSPPPSPPARGRSPSLALPEHPDWSPDGQRSFSQNVGTIALPGSHERSSELPVFIDPALPSGNSHVLQLRPPAQNEPPRAPPPPRRTNHAPALCERSASRLPSPAPHTLHTDRTLRDLVGLISHFEPVATAPSSRPPPITVASPRSNHPPETHAPGTAQNPIEIDAPGAADAVNSALIALAGTVASALKLPTGPHDVPSLSKPTVNNVLHLIKHDPKLIPALQATYEYLGSVPNQPQPPPQSFSHVSTDKPPKRKRRRKNPGPQIPAGAGHWNVPFPFAPGQGPNDYPSQWQLDRGRAVLGELLGLFERAFAKARGDEGKAGAPPRPRKRQRTHGPESSTESEFEGTVGGTDHGRAPRPDAEGGCLDQQRMSDWLSSVPALSTPSSIVESSNAPSPSPSDPAPLSSNGWHDLLAILGSNFFEDPSPTAANVSAGDKDSDAAFDFAGAFNEVGVDGEDAANWQSLFGAAPTAQSINDITAFPMGFEVAPLPHPPSQPAAPPPSHDFVIDPALMALSQPQSPATQSSQSTQPAQTQAQASSDLGFFTAASDALVSLMGPSIATAPPTRAEPQRAPWDVRDADTDARSMLTVPTTSASSSRRGSTPMSMAASALTAPRTAASTSAISRAKAERRAAVLAKAREHRARLVGELESARVERWGTVIEGGVLRNIGKGSVPS